MSRFHTETKQDNNSRHQWVCPPMHGEFDESVAVTRVTEKNTEAYMVNPLVIGNITPQKSYLITANGYLIKTNKPTTPFSKQLKLVGFPPQISLTNTWEESVTGSTVGTNRNILGDDGLFTLPSSSLTIPIAPTTPENLAFYNAQLLNHSDHVVFDGDVDLPLSFVKIGEDYVPDFLLQEDLGGGAAIEWHRKPHYHQPLDRNTGGHLILGRFSPDETNVMLSAFNIPYGQAVYTSPMTIHADSYLTGNWAVVYATTPDASTVILKDPAGEIADVKIAHLKQPITHALN